MNIFIRRLTIIVADAERDAANQIATEITSNPADAATYSVPLSATGHEPATHWGCSTVASDEMVGAMQANMPRVPSVRFFLLDAASEALLSTNVEAAQNQVSHVLRFEDALRALDLQRVVPPVEGMEVMDAQVLAEAPAEVAGDSGHAAPG